MDQARRLGFKFGRDGSPYVMNKYDDIRHPDKNSDGWGQVKKDFGPVEFPANQDAGAFVIYRDIMALAGTPIGDVSGVRLEVEPPAETLPQSEEIERAKDFANKIMSNPKITFDNSVQDRVRKSMQDVIDDGKTFTNINQDNKHEVAVSANLLAAVLEMTDNDIPIQINCLTTGHDDKPGSSHVEGSGIDLGIISDELAQKTFKYLFDNSRRLGVDELIYSGNIPDGTTTLNDGVTHEFSQGIKDIHRNHIHLRIKHSNKAIPAPTTPTPAAATPEPTATPAPAVADNSDIASPVVPVAEPSEPKNEKQDTEADTSEKDQKSEDKESNKDKKQDDSNFWDLFS